jgi:hypothetical protein
MGLPDRVSEWAREATKRRNANVGVGERVELDQLVGKYSRHRHVLHDRRLVFTEKAAYFLEADGVQPTEVVEWSEVVLVELVRSVTGTCVLDILMKDAMWWGMRTVCCDFYAADAEMWEMWNSCLSVAAQGPNGPRFRLVVADDYAAANGICVDGGVGGDGIGKNVARVAADDVRATMNWVRAQWSQMRSSRASDLTGDEGLFSIRDPKLWTERSESVSTATYSPTAVKQGDVATSGLPQGPFPVLGKSSASTESVNALVADSRSTSASSASDMRSISTSANAETSASTINANRFAAAQAW